MVQFEDGSVTGGFVLKHIKSHKKSFSCERGVLADVSSSVFEFSIECSSLNMKILAWA